jgi:hypothetical protein
MADNTEVNQFLKDLSGEEQSIVDKPLITGDEEPGKETPRRMVELDEDGYPKNRQGRRKRAQDEGLRSEIAQLTERVKVLSEVGKFREEVGEDHLSKVEAIFGTNTPEKLAATNLLKEALQGMSDKAKAEAIKELETRSEKQTESEREAQKEADGEVNEFLETAEDEGIDISDDNVRSGLITLMERMSKKYDDGNIKEFADAENVVEVFKELQKRTGSSRAKDLASRSMARSGESEPSKLPQNAIDRFVQDAGIAW